MAKKKEKPEKDSAPPPTPRLQTLYEEEIVPQLKEKLERDNRLSLPRLEKIVVSMGVGSAMTDKKHMEEATAALAEITGQKPVRCKARKSIADFRLREGLDVGCKVTLRGARMYEFLDRLISLALPRVRDFRGLNPERVRRQRQLQPGPERTARVPRAESGQVHPRAGHEHYDLLLRSSSDDEIARDVAGVRHAVPPRRCGSMSKLLAVSCCSQKKYNRSCLANS